MDSQEELAPKPPVNEDLVSTPTYTNPSYPSSGSYPSSAANIAQKTALPQNGYTVRIAWKNRRRMAWVSLIAMLIATGLVFFVVPESRLKIIGDVITWFYFAMTSVVGAYMGFTTWASIKGQGK
jgi:hypothetical protein